MSIGIYKHKPAKKIKNMNLYEQFKNLEKRVKELSKDPEPKTPDLDIYKAPVLRPVFLDNIKGQFETLSDTVTHTPRNFNEQLVIVATNGKHYMGFHFNDGWWFIRATNSVA